MGWLVSKSKWESVRNNNYRDNVVYLATILFNTKSFVKINDDTKFNDIQIKVRTLSIQNMASCNLIIDNTDRIDCSIYYTNFQYYKIIDCSYSYSTHFDVI